MSEWPVQSLRGKIHVKHGFPFKGEHFQSSGRYVVLTPGNFHEEGGFKRNAEKDKCYSEPFPEDYLLKEGDVVVAMTEQTDGLLGSMAKIPESRKFLHNQRLGLVTSLAPEVDVGFLYHLFKTKSVREQIRRSASGSKVKHTSPDRIYDVIVPLPQPAEQQRIAAVLSALEAKIELNQRLNAELEGLATLLYDYWFVQYDFPLSPAQAADLRQPHLTGQPYRTSGGPMVYNEPLKREIPKGWEVCCLGELAENVRDGVDPKTSDSKVPYVGLEHIGRQNFALWQWGASSDVDSQKSAFKSGDFLFGKLRPYFHKVCQTPFDGICSTDILVIRAKAEHFRAFVGCQIFDPEFVDYTMKFSSGTQMPRANWNSMADYVIPMPQPDTLKEFQSLIQTVWAKANSSVLENHHLAQLRDWLLPMLMNGQVRVTG